MRKINDLTGKTFGIWKIVKKTNKKLAKRKKTMYNKEAI